MTYKMRTPKQIQWHEPLPPCDFCSIDEKTIPAPYDGKTTRGPWANMCDEHLVMHGYPQSHNLTSERVKLSDD